MPEQEPESKVTEKADGVNEEINEQGKTEKLRKLTEFKATISAEYLQNQELNDGEKLKEINFRACKFEDSSEIWGILMSKKILVNRLLLEYNEFRDLYSDSFVDFVSSSEVEYFSILGSSVSPDEMETFVNKMIEKSKEGDLCFKVLTFRHNKFGDKGFKAVAKLVNLAGGVAKLTASNCHIKKDGFEAFKDTITTHIHTFDISRSDKISRNVMPFIADIVEKCRIEDLHMEKCNLGSDVPARLARSGKKVIHMTIPLNFSKLPCGCSTFLASADKCIVRINNVVLT